MKKLLFGLLALYSFSTFATDCSEDAKQIGKMNLDQVAIKYGHKNSDIFSDVTFLGTKRVKLFKNIKEDLYEYKVLGSIYKAEYRINVTVNEECAVRSVSIHSVLL